MPTPKGTSAKLRGAENATKWDRFVKKCDKDGSWHDWISGSRLNKTRIAKHLGFSKDVFDDNPNVDISTDQSRLITNGTIAENKKPKGNSKLSKKDAAQKKRIDEINKLLSVELANLFDALMTKQDEVTLINFSLSDDLEIDLNGLKKAIEMSDRYSAHLTRPEQLREAKQINMLMREWKMKATQWVKRIQVSEIHLARSLRIPKWI